MRISVVMPVYNCAGFVGAAIESVLSQTFADFEFIIVNDRSTDATADIVRGYAGKDARIVLIENGRNMGVTASLNVGLRAARGEFVARMDGDDLSIADRFERELKVLDSEPDVWAVAGKHVAFWGEAVPAADAAQGEGFAEISLERQLEDNQVCHGSAMFRRREILGLGGYDEALPYAQDAELWINVLRHARMAVLERTVYFLRIHPGSVSSRHVLAQQKAAERGRNKHRAEMGLEPLNFFREHACMRFFSLAKFQLRSGHPAAGALSVLRAARVCPGLFFAKQLLSLLRHALGLCRVGAEEQEE